MTDQSATRAKGRGGYVAGLSVARGIQVTLMVTLFHSLEGLFRAETPMPYGVWESQEWIEPLRMPLFFLVSGVLIHRLLSKSFTDQWRSRVTELIWPMIIGHYSIVTVQFLAASQTNGGMSLSDYPFLPLPPYAHLWFMWAMLLITGAVILTHAVLGRFGWARYTGLITFAVALSLQGIEVPAHLNDWWLDRVIEDAPYIPLGMLLGAMITGWTLSPQQVRLFTLTGVIAATAAVLLDGAIQIAMVMLANVALLWVLCSICTTEGHGWTARMTRFWAYLGDRSLVIYLYHIIWTSGVRIGLDVLFGITTWYVVAPVALVFGVAGPLLMLWGVDKITEALKQDRNMGRAWAGLPAR